MTVAQLIEVLKTCRQDARVFVPVSLDKPDHFTAAIITNIQQREPLLSVNDPIYLFSELNSEPILDADIIYTEEKDEK